MTQACDLEQEKVRNVVACPHLSLSDYKATWEAFLRQRNQNPTAKAWRTHCNDIKDGYAWNLSILNRSSVTGLEFEHRIVDFHEVFTVPREFLESCSGDSGPRSAAAAYRRTANICPKRSPVISCVWACRCRSTRPGRADRRISFARVETCEASRRFPGDDRAMTPPDPISPTGPAVARRFLPVLLVLFVGSGCAALIYEVVWLQLLQLVIGSTAVSLGVLLGTFMGGMCVGSLLLPRLVRRGGTRCGSTPCSSWASAPSGSRCCSACRMSNRCIRITPATARRASCCAGPWPGCACCRPRC